MTNFFIDEKFKSDSLFLSSFNKILSINWSNPFFIALFAKSILLVLTFFSIWILLTLNKLFSDKRFPVFKKTIKITLGYGLIGIAFVLHTKNYWFKSNYLQIVKFAVKPTSSILTSRKTINKSLENVSIITKGRHDPCVGIRAVPVGEAMIAIILADCFLINQSRKKTGI